MRVELIDEIDDLLFARKVAGFLRDGYKLLSSGQTEKNHHIHWWAILSKREKKGQ